MTARQNPWWRDQAACLEYPTRAYDPWYTVDSRRADQITREPCASSIARRAAMSVCARCPVITECLTYALDYETEHDLFGTPHRRARNFGIFGGRTPAQRSRLINRTLDRRAAA